MASKASAAIALLVSLNLLFFTMTNATEPAEPAKPAKHPIVTLKNCDGHDLTVCVGVLTGILQGKVGTDSPCCTVLKSVVNANAQVCLCAIVDLNLLGLVRINLTADLDVALNQCGISVPTYTCSSTPTPSIN